MERGARFDAAMREPPGPDTSPRAFAVALAVACTFGAAAPAQVDRHELGLRLTAFERRLGASAHTERRAAAFAALDRAVRAFFRLDLAGVARAIDAADVALGAPDSAAHRHARRLRLAVDARLVDAAAEGAAVRADAVYPADESDAETWPTDLVLRVEALATGAAAVELPLGSLPATGLLPLADVPPGDHVLRWSVRRGQDVLVRREQGLSVAVDLAARLERLERAAEGAGAIAPATLESATLPALVKLLTGMQRRRAEETVLPGARLLEEAERLAAAIGASPPSAVYGDDAPGDFHLRVPLRGGVAAVRLSVPPEGDGPRPLVVALHGAGGSENLFFDGYGAGAIVALARARGWFVVAPRMALGGVDCGALADALAARFAIDRDRVVVVGHSMGAMQAVQQATREPSRFRALAALGGGGAVARGVDLSPLPCFVGVGERDFARAGAASLRTALTRAGAPCTWREYPAVEHLAIVQVALPDVFAFFDEALGARTAR